MANLKKQNDKGQWEVVASGNSNSISVTDPKLLDEGKSVESVDDVLKKQKEDIDLLKRNVAWLALHGGGGSGGGGGIGGSSTAPCTIFVNNVESGGTVVVDEANGLQIHLEDLTTNAMRAWTVTVTMAGQTVIRTTASYTSPNVFIALSRFKHLLSNHTGNMNIGASYADETNGVYGSASWTGTIIESAIEFTGPGEISYTFDNLKEGTTDVNYTYSVGVLGSYNLTYEVYKDGKLHNTVNYTGDKALNITSTSKTARNESLNTLLGFPKGDDLDELTCQGNYIIEAKLQNVENLNISATCRTSITIQSKNIFVSSLVLSTNPAEPTEVSLSSSINVSFTAFLQNISDFTYDYLVNNQVIKEGGKGYFGQQVSDSISLSNKDWAKEGETITFGIRIKTTGQEATANFYIKFIAASNTFLSEDADAIHHTLTSFVAYDYDDGISSISFSNPKFLSGSMEVNLTSQFRTFQPNSLSTVSTTNYIKYLRLSNGAYGVIRDWGMSGSTRTLPNMLTAGNFTISIVFKADYHPDDNRTILFSGSVNSVSGEITRGISIDVHDVYVNNASVVKLTDKTINIVDITCEKTTSQDITSSGVVEKESYVVKVYLDGVLTSVSSMDSMPQLGDQIWLGARVYQQGGQNVSLNLCDCNIYSLKIYDSVLDDLQIMTNQVNSIVYTNYKNGQPNFDLIPIELKKNFCERQGDSINSLLYKNGQYTVDFLIDTNTGLLSEEALNDYAGVLGIPIMMIDVSGDDNWTFNNFVSQQTASAVTLPATNGRNIYYWDPNGTNQKVVNVTDVSISLQGTSTLSDAVKNLNITVPNDTVFIPKDTWFPEQTYTLKADVVDSSHSNNAAIGSFINTVLGYQENASNYGAAGSSYFPFDSTAISNVYESDYKKNQQNTVTLKHTVEGFPVLLILKFHVSSTSTVNTTPVGIYSFNIGRDAYRNLGFRKVNKITDRTTNDSPVITDFPFYLTNCAIDETDSNANWIEISDTTALKSMIDLKLDEKEGTSVSFPADFDSSQGDFWQSDDSILDERYEVRYGQTGKTNTSDYPKFKRFVEYIAQLPIEGILATPKTISGDIIRQVVDGSYDMYKYAQVGQNYVYQKTGQKQTITTDVNALPARPFNEESAYKYFVIALLFGLVDNFGKNSTYRSWGDGDYYVDFYDMDTALGGSNQGQLDIFPDCWIKYLYNKKSDNNIFGYLIETFDPDQEGRSRTAVSANHNKLWLSLDTSFYRNANNNAGVKSLYTQYWYNLRVFLENAAAAHGYSNFYDWFIDEYFTNQTGDCGALLFNYDYKLKYLLQFQPGDKISTRDLPKLHGRKIAYCRDWLKKHIIFLDSLFYWRDNNQTLNFKSNVNNQGSNTIRRTPEAFPMSSNSPIAMYYSIGNTVQTFVFLQQNTETYVDAGPNTSESDIKWTFNNSPNIITLGNNDTPLSRMNVNILDYSPGSQGLDTVGYPSVTNLNLSNNTTFNQAFSLAAFEQGEVSEVRELNFANTRTTTGGRFPISLVSNASGGGTYTKYTKLTSINISGADAVSSLTIPNVPLTNLQVRGSAITEFTLERQNYIKDVDLDGCSNLQTISLRECNSYSQLEIDNLPNLVSVEISNCENIDHITINNCKVLSRVYISGNTALKKVTINNCESLMRVGNGDDCLIFTNGNTALEELDLSNNSNLNTFIFSNSNASGLKKLNLSYTKITNFRTSSDVSENTELLDLYEFTSLVDVDLSNNNSIKNIQFANNEQNPISITHTFQGCSNLERVYGSIKLHNTTSSDGTWGIFYGCSKFSIHGTNVSTWNGKAVKSGNVWKTVWECVSGVSGTAANAATEFNKVTLNQLFAGGRLATNIFLNDQTNVMYMMFNGCISMTQFDIYYMLTVFALSGITANQNIYRAFRTLSGQTTNAALWDWASGNQPSRWMFYKCSKITSLSEVFSNSGTTYLPAPESGKDNGLLSPLTDITTFYSPWSGSVFISKKFFTRTSGNYESLTNIGPLAIHTISDNDSDFTSPSSLSDQMHFASVAGNIGNFDGFFANMPNLRSIVSFCTGTRALNLSQLVIPTTVTTIQSSFNTSGSGFARGSLDLTKIFPAGSNCTEISNSFRISAVAPMAGAGFTTSPVEMPLTANTFSNLTKLQYLGYRDVSYGGSMSSFSFDGAGIQKRFTETSFPYGIFSKCPGLINCAGVFKGATASFTTVPGLPGTLFSTHTALQNIPSLFENVNFAFSLTGEGFAKCTNLTNVAYLFAHDVPSTPASRSKIDSMIPYRMFYHGSTEGTRVVKGSNQTSEPAATAQPDLSTSVNITIFNTNITNMQGCFKGCVGLKPYTTTNVPAERNNEYSPYTWTYDETTGSWSKTEDDNKKQNDASWGYCGVPSTKANTTTTKYLEGNDVEQYTAPSAKSNETLNYCCAPDLFRYCKNTGEVNIKEVFCDCGLRYNSASGGVGNATTDESTAGYVSTGMYGRIPPYLLKPVSNVRNITGLFEWCRRLSSVVTDSGSRVYQIPKDFFTYATGINTLVRSFRGLSFVNNTVLDVFGPLTASLDITAIFTMANWLGTASYTVSNVFASNKLSRISGAFSLRDVTLIDNSPYVQNAGVNAVWSLRSGITFNRCLPDSTNSIPRATDTAFVYGNIAESRVTENAAVMEVLRSGNQNFA